MNAREEIAAGGIVFRKERGKIFILFILDPYGQWTFPKGHVEEEESIEETARREIQEETGVSDLMLIRALKPAQYTFQKDKREIRKTVQYFIFESTDMGTPQPQTDEGIQDARWVKSDDVEDVIGYRETNTELLKQTMKFVSRQ